MAFRRRRRAGGRAAGDGWLFPPPAHIPRRGVGVVSPCAPSRPSPRRRRCPSGRCVLASARGAALFRPGRRRLSVVVSRPVVFRFSVVNAAMGEKRRSPSPPLCALPSCRPPSSSWRLPLGAQVCRRRRHCLGKRAGGGNSQPPPATAPPCPPPSPKRHCLQPPSAPHRQRRAAVCGLRLRGLRLRGLRQQLRAEGVRCAIRHSPRHSLRHSLRHRLRHSETPMFRAFAACLRHSLRHRARHRARHKPQHT